MLKIKATTSQLGLAIEASNDGGKTWLTIQLVSFRTRKNGIDGHRPYQTWIDPAQDVEDYFKTITEREIKFERVRER